ncbi:MULTISPECIES: hypothetical protein [unclassified Oleiphilus]|uniref:hypothetical protein n=1 Tax=unclassified Oleiphilus TaxID=2631174 RepID=UPI0007C2426D|nr:MULTISPECIES: hypothetical protein [unclassified Oleiphilus]KZY72406.1 hypothetical protein A3740_20820 [Oleiphilus sp. HI0068]KZY87604.1 hypothetical protein A3741_13420 [Oleiphilus sp. HI0069]KZY90831.1 hypothetical protein A3743_07305 [Oleiphilus sp. HI0072]KZZ12330.1 hypothetical protein A3749_06715 [Oleiphilus sp. HI0078]KZZ22104.1 hypothetical protein A3752_00790 [Oleiphilus sp. HI0081]KZZ46610.1 hypothetical protein A3755_18160 [Oleiphilus sp. HI0085]
MTTKASKEASRLAKQNTAPRNSNGTELIDQELPSSPALHLVEFNHITVDKYSAEQIREMYQNQLTKKAS